MLGYSLKYSYFIREIVLLVELVFCLCLGTFIFSIEYSHLQKNFQSVTLFFKFHRIFYPHKKSEKVVN